MEKVANYGLTSYWFKNRKLAKIDIPKGVKIIEDRTFAYCKNLKEISLPKTICFMR